MEQQRYPEGLSITVNDFIDSGCQGILQAMDAAADYSDYWSVLSKHAREKIEAEEFIAGKILWLLADALSMSLNPDSQNEPFKPFAINYQTNSRSTVIDDFTEDDIAFFEAILDLCDDYIVKSRLADILWTKKSPKNPEHLNIAIENYQMFSLAYDDILNDSKQAWERAIRLLILAKKPLTATHQKLMEEFRSATVENGYHLSWIQELLRSSRIDESYHDEVISKLEAFANEFKSQGDFHRARDYFQDCQSWTKDENRIHAFTVKVAECHEHEAEHVNELSSSLFYQKALDTYRRIPRKYRDSHDVDKKLDEIRRKLRDANLKTLDFMQPMDLGTIELTKTIEWSRKQVSDKNLPDAVRSFVNLFDHPTETELKKSAVESIQKFSIQKLFGATHYSSDGRVVAQRAGMDFSDTDSEAYQQGVLHDMLQSYDLQIDLITKGHIIPAYQQLTYEHRITIDTLRTLCAETTIIPQYREEFWAQGFYFGFEHNFMVSTHLLIPQIEHLVRIKMNEAGLKTSTIDKEGIETENSLSTLLSHEKVSDVFHENLLFEFRALLTEQVGANLRNNVAHGLSSVYSVSSVHAIYFWYLCLKLVVNSIPYEEEV